VTVPIPVESVSSRYRVSDEDYTQFASLGKFLWESQSEDIISDETKHQTSEVEEGLATFIQRKEQETGIETRSVLHNLTNNTMLAHFLRRPVKISSFTWNESDPVGALRFLNPWSLWATNTYVTNKLNNYAFFPR